MPIYTFECKKCDHRFEHLCKFVTLNAEAHKNCREEWESVLVPFCSICGGEVRKIPSVPAKAVIK